MTRSRGYKKQLKNNIQPWLIGTTSIKACMSSLSQNNWIVKKIEYKSVYRIIYYLTLNIHVHVSDISLPKGYNQAKTYKQGVGASREGPSEVLFVCYY